MPALLFCVERKLALLQTLPEYALTLPMDKSRGSVNMHDYMEKFVRFPIGRLHFALIYATALYELFAELVEAIARTL